MIEINDNIKMGIIGVLALLVGFGGNVLLDSDLIDKTYVCPLTEDVGIFDRLSSSGKTGYYMDDIGEQAERCRVGNTYSAWTKISVYAEDKGVSINDLLNKEQINEPIQTSGDKWQCSSEGCIKIEE